jgi:energy-coupling factor transport system substrate-specific component
VSEQANRLSAAARRQFFCFLLLGTLAASINWLVRFPLSRCMPFEIAVMAAYLIGMTVGYLLYKHYVFPGRHAPLGAQMRNFVLINLIGIVIVAALSSVLANQVLPNLIGARDLREALAHGLAIGTSAATSFAGHKWVTFAR